MSHRESYSSVSVSRVNWYIRCGYSGCMSLYESGIGVDRYVLLGCAADGVFKELSDIFYKNKWFIFKYFITYYVLL